MAKLRFNFTFPFRWLKEDRQFLKENLTKRLPKSQNKLLMSQVLMDDEPPVYRYSIRFKQHAYQPHQYKMTKEELTDIFQEVFPGSQCQFFEPFFVQRNSPSGLPVMEIEIYF